MSKSQKIAAVSLTIAGSVTIFAVLIWHRQPECESLQDALARAFNRPAQLIELNLPSADGRYPGAVTLAPQPGQVLPLKRVGRPDAIPRAATSLRVSLRGEADASLSNSFIGAAGSEGNLALELHLDDLRLFEADLSAAFRSPMLLQIVLSAIDGMHRML